MPVCGSGAVVWSLFLLCGTHPGRCQAETPLIPLFRFPEPALFFTNLSGASLTDANLSGANLNSADLSGVDLRGVDLSGVDLSDAAFATKAENLDRATFCNTTMPDGTVNNRDCPP
jgi:hypothetical protein